MKKGWRNNMYKEIFKTQSKSPERSITRDLEMMANF